MTIATQPRSRTASWRHACGRLLTWVGTPVLALWLLYRAWMIAIAGIIAPGSQGNDFAIFRQSARLLLHGDNPYALPSSLNPNLNHPFVALWTVPFALPPAHIGFLLWDGLSLVAWLAALLLTVRVAGLPRHLWLRPLPIVFVLTYTGFMSAVQLGQISPFLTLLLVSGWALARRGRNTLACAIFGALIALKLALLPLAAIALAGDTRRSWWRGPAALLSGALGVSLAVLPFVGVVGYHRWLSGLAAVDYGSLFITNMSIVGWWFHLHPTSPALLAQVSTVLGCLAALLVVRSRAPRAWQPTDWRMGTLLVIALLTSPIAWDHYLPFLAPLGGGSVVAWPHLSQAARWCSIGGLVAVLGYLEIRSVIWTMVGWPPRMGSILCIGLLFLLVALMLPERTNQSN